jgi:hypothetical protein
MIWNGMFIAASCVPYEARHGNFLHRENMENFVHRENMAIFKRRLAETKDVTVRENLLLQLLEAEQARMWPNQRSKAASVGLVPLGKSRSTVHG